MGLLANLQGISNGVFGFKIEQKTTSNEARNDDLVTIDRQRLIEAQANHQHTEISKHRLFTVHKRPDNRQD